MCETSKGKAFGEHFWKTRGYWVFCESSPPWPVLCEAVTGHLADQVTDKWNVCEYEMTKWIGSVLGVNHRWNLSEWSETKMPAECPVSASRGRAADLRVIFTWSLEDTMAIIVWGRPQCSMMGGCHSIIVNALIHFHSWLNNAPFESSKSSVPIV